MLGAFKLIAVFLKGSKSPYPSHSPGVRYRISLNVNKGSETTACLDDKIEAQCYLEWPLHKKCFMHLDSTERHGNPGGLSSSYLGITKHLSSYFEGELVP